jgi:hypothetical protein
MTSYRPLSFLIVFTKVLEKATQCRLSQLPHSNVMLFTELYGFRKEISIEDDDSFRLSDSVVKSINQKMYVGGIFCELSKAFDCMNHEMFLAELHFFGIRGVSEGCFRSYVTSTRQKVEVQ